MKKRDNVKLKTWLRFFGVLGLIGLIWYASTSNSKVEPIVPTPELIPVYDEGKVSEWEGALQTITIKEGESFQYWSYTQQEWIFIKLEKLSVEEIVFFLPLWLNLENDPSSLIIGSNYVIESSSPAIGRLTHLWVKVEGENVTISAGSKRLVKN